MFPLLKRINLLHPLFDALLVIGSLYASMMLRVGWPSASDHYPTLLTLLPLFVAVRLTTFIALGVYDIKWRYVSTRDALRIIRAIVISSVLIVAATYLVNIGRLPRSTFLIDTVLITLLIAGSRLLRRVIYEHDLGRKLGSSGRLTLIYGAGTVGRELAHRFRTNAALGFKLVGFVDDDPSEVGRSINGVRVLGTKEDLPTLLDNHPIEEFVVAISDVPASSLRHVMEASTARKLRPRIVADPTKKIRSTRPDELLRDVELSDLLGRPKKSIDLSVVHKLIAGKRVLITGAGGSIGSELARQVIEFGPARALLLDHSEFNLYNVDHELRIEGSDSNKIVPILADIKDRASLENIFKEYRPEIVFHAAAYKHVDLVERNPFPAILNNVLGTKNLVELAEEFSVEAFVQISTDKAVNPAGIMGATKRVCELLVNAAGDRTGRTYCSVRFGNVLGSSGSLIPLLKRQISNGEPLTITHPDMRRFFMLISEAVSLVLKAATISRPGEVLILKMGDPIKIVDIASSLRVSMGKTEEENPIVFTGLRPGEKMFEELYLCGNELSTEHPDILILPRGDTEKSGESQMNALFLAVDRMIINAQDGAKEAVFELSALVDSNYLEPERSVALAANAEGSNVLPLKSDRNAPRQQARRGNDS